MDLWTNLEYNHPIISYKTEKQRVSKESKSDNYELCSKHS